MSYEFYKILHTVGVFMVVMALSGMILGAWISGGKSFAPRKFLAATHGIGLLLTLVAGFGLLARLGLVTGIPSWALLKLGIWLVLGVFTLLVYRIPRLGAVWWVLVLIAASSAAVLARLKIEL